MASYAYDDDEEDPPVGFEQDPDEDELGTGTWIYKDGSRRYSKGDASEAKALLAKKAPLAEAGAKLAGGDFASEKRPQATRAEMSEATSGLAGEKSPEEQFLDSTTGAEEDEQAEASEQPKPLAPGEGPRGRPMDAPAAPESAPPVPGPPGTMRPPSLPGAGGPARYTDRAEASESQSATTGSSSSSSTQRSAMPGNEFAAQQEQIGRSYGESIDAAGQGARSQADSILQRRDALMQLASDKEAATAAAQAQQAQRAAVTTQKIKEVSARKTDMNGLWKEKGALGTTLGLLGVALRSLNATKFGGPNTALQSIQEQRKQNLQAQMEDRDSELRGLERELGGLDAAVPVLEARMRDAEIKRLDGMLANEKSQEVLANGERLKTQLGIERDQKLKEAATAYYGTVAKQESAQAQASRTQGGAVSRDRLSGAGVGDEGRGGGDPAEQAKKWLEYEKSLEERGMPPDSPERKHAREMGGIRTEVGESAPAQTNREQREKVDREAATYSEDQAKAEAAFDTLMQFGDDSGLTRDKNDDFEDPGFIAGSVKPGWEEPLTETLGRPTPVKDSRKVASQAVGRLVSGGMIGKDEGEEITTLIGDPTATKAQIASRLNRLKRMIVTRRKANRRDAPTGPSGKRMSPE